MNKIEREAYSIPHFLRKIILAWLFVCTVQYCFLDRNKRALESLDGLSALSLPLTLAMTGIVFAGLLLLGRYFSLVKAERYAMLCCAAVYFLFAAVSAKNLVFSITAVLLIAFFGVYAIWGHAKEASPEEKVKKCHKIWPVLLAACAAVFCVLLCVWTVGRVVYLTTPTYDFGLFAQMFHNMKTTGLASTTLERDGFLSHFSVHVSPIYYLLLPFYALVPRPETLQVLQALILTSSVIPLWLIARYKGLGGGGSFLVCLMLLLYPALGGGVGYDIHENAFLTPLLLWLFYFLEKRKLCGIALTALLTLMVKEDAAVYVAVIGLWWLARTLLGRKEERRWGLFVGFGLLFGAILWFLAATAYLRYAGEGVMTDRYENFDYAGDASLLSVVKACVLLPVKVIFECVNEEKLVYLMQTMVPILALPLLTRKFERLLLLIPYFLVNLMPDYPYQHSILFQYNFGSLACLFYLTVVNLRDLRSWAERHRAACLPVVGKMTAAATILLSIIFFTSVVCPQMISDLNLTKEAKTRNLEVYDYLRSFDPDARVCSTTYFTTGLSSRKELYDIEFCSEETWREHVQSADYIILDKHQDYTFYNLQIRMRKTYEALEEELLKRGFILVETVGERAAVFVHP